MKELFASIITDNTALELDKTFTYKIPNHLIDYAKVGMRVLIPFGRGNKVIKGLIVRISDSFSGNFKVKNILEILDTKPIINDNLLKLSSWMRKKYLSSYNSCLQTVLPPGNYKEVNTFVRLLDKEYNPLYLDEARIIEYLKKINYVIVDDLKKDIEIDNINKILNRLEEDNIIQFKIDVTSNINIKYEKHVRLKVGKEDYKATEQLLKNAKKQLEVFNLLTVENNQSMKDLLIKANTSNSVVKGLEEKDIIEIYDVEVERKAVKNEIEKYEKHILNNEQRYVYDEILKSNNKSTLIHGITGSGKTEIYLQLVEKMIEQNKESIILVPEISLTPQTIDRFVGRFGENVAVLHSKLSQGERFDQWRKIKNKEVKIVVGARSAIFAPFDNLGLIVIDEEHETSYKSSQNPKYDTIEVAKKRSELEDCLLVLGTATPSVTTYYKALEGHYNLLELKNRANQNELPEIELVDMREELQLGNRSIFSDSLRFHIQKALEENKQIILFLNKRGYSTFVSCRECGHVIKCEKCDISMTYHRNINRLKCHYCGETRLIPNICPECGSKYIKYFGIGTQQVEMMVREEFANARVARMDADTVSKKDSHFKILEKVKNKEIDILIGTQMISKGLDFEDVVVVGIIAADTALNLPDYQAPEKTFQLVTQVAGRTGRGKYGGKVILQTYSPEHYSIEHAKNQDFIEFYKEEIEIRKMFLYPPFVELVNIIISGENIKKVQKISKSIYTILGSEIYNIYKEDYFKYINGPNPAPIEKIRNNFRYQIIVKVEKDNMEKLKELLYRVYILNSYKLDLDNININIDINPTSIL